MSYPFGGDLVNDINARMSALANYRLTWESDWSTVADYCLPDHQRFSPGNANGVAAYDQFALGPTSVERGRIRYDDTALRAVDRLGSGMESLVTPQSGKWHGLALSNPLAPEATDEEKEYFERLRDYHFAMRYNSRSGFIGAHQKALRSAIALGTGIVYVEEAIGGDEVAVPALYRYLPLSECYLAVDAQGEPDTLYRRFTMTARQMVQRFGKDKVCEAVRRAANNQTDRDKNFVIIHAVQPRKEANNYGAGTAQNAPWSSCYVDRDNACILGESGFYEFPFIVYYWQPVEQNIPYAQSAVMNALSEIKGLNAMRKATLKGTQMYLDPPSMVAHDGVMNRPNLNPGRMNYGMLDSQGRARIQFLSNGTRPDFITEILKYDRDSVNDALYINMFQILINSPNMTATEALIRANEKGELLGPAGSKIQTAMARLVDREGGIIERKGAFRPGAALAPPRSLVGKSFHAAFTSPLDRLRMAAEGLGIQRTLQTLLPLAQIKPEVADNLDMDWTVRKVGEIEGAPQKMWVPVDQRDATRQQNQQMQAAQRAAELAKTGGEAAKNIVPAMGQMAQLAGLPGMKPATGAAP